MNYELAKKLKEAGFPQGEIKCRCILNPCQCNKNFDYEPTLSELIEACGNKFGELGLQDYMDLEPYEKWRASLGWDGIGGYEKAVYGETPEEAIANLWLKLNEK